MAEEQISLRDELSATFDEITAAENEPVVPVEETAEQKAGRTAGRSRDEHGRLLPGKAVKDAAVSPVTVPQDGTVPVAAARPTRPSSWKKEHWEDWDKLDPRVAGYISQREQEFASGVSTYKAEADKAKELWDVIAPFQPLIQAEGGTPAAAVKDLLQTAATLRQADPQTKVQLLLRVAQQYGVPLQQYFGGQQPRIDPQSQWLAQQVQQLQGQLNSFKTTQEQQSQSQIQSEIEKFKATHEHFETVREKMAGLLQSNLAPDLESAYDQAIRLHDDIWEKVTEKKAQDAATQKAAAAKEAAQNARAKTISPKSATPGDSTGQGKKGLRGQLEEAFDDHVSGRV